MHIPPPDAKHFHTLALYLIRKLILRFDVIGIAARLNAPKICARLVNLVSNRIDTGGRNDVLCLSRSIFDEDITTMAAYGGKLNYVLVPKEVFISITRVFLPELLYAHANYHDPHNCTMRKSDCRLFLVQLLRAMKVRRNFSAILSANYNYSWQQELCAAAIELNIPVGIYFKEGISPLQRGSSHIVDPHLALVQKYTNNKFIGSKLFVYNNLVRNAFINAGIMGINKSTVATVGIARFDRYFHLAKNGTHVVFFSFNLEEKTRHLEPSSVELQVFFEKTKAFHAEVIKFALENPHEKVIIKTKSNPKFIVQIRALMQEMNCLNLPNLTITNEANVFDLIKNAKAVIGYNSTALLEALAARRLVMCADFKQDNLKDFFHDYPRLASRVTTANDIKAVLSRKHMKISPDDRELISILFDRIHTPDGRASKRLESSILDMIAAN